MSRDPNQYNSSYGQLNTNTNTESTSPGNTNLPPGPSPTSPYSDRPVADMATLPPPSHLQPQDLYRPHSAYTMYSPHGQSFPPSQQPGTNPSQQAPTFASQPAPRQRTAIACRYCRRRKIRCHGFDSSPDGRCTNCMRFHQECIFTPVSTQGHAFVPAHTAYPHLRNTRGMPTGPDGRPFQYSSQGGPAGPPLYGAHGQPLGPVGQHEANYPPHPPAQGAYPPAPYAAQVTLPAPQATPPPPIKHYEERTLTMQDHRGKPLQRRGSSGYEYSDPMNMAPTSPASSATSYQSTAYASSSAQPYYHTASGDSRTSPTSAYLGPRSAGSPLGSSGPTVLPPLPIGLHPPQSLPSAFDPIRNPSPSTSSSRTGGLSVADMLTPTSGTRSSTDTDMLYALDHKRR